MSAAFRKKPHRKDCTGTLRRSGGTVYTDGRGAMGNGPYIAHVYDCTEALDGCHACVLVLESAVRELALAVEVRL